jgi:molecular chaperone GrpE
MTDSVPQEEQVMDEDALADAEAASGVSDDANDAADAGDAPSGEFEELNDRHLRLVAEFNNYRRRTEQERLGAWARAQADIVEKFLDVLDDLNRVAQLDLSNATVEAIMEGVDLVERKFIRVLEDSGAEVIDPAGQAFDPERMEAMMRLPAETDDQDDQVAQVFQKGYSLKGVLVRPARVSVYKNG